jgi:NAD(P)-dependent dehydrogenase (short-subunit alcohol dehydrogenase family)
MHYDLEDKVALVTGGAGGIGGAVSSLLAKSGARVVVADIAPDAAARKVEEIKAAGGDAMAVTMDLEKESDIDATFEAVMDTYGRLDFLDNNAALLTPEIAHRDGNIEDMLTEVWDRTYAVNARGTMLCCRAALKIMRAQGKGSIVNTASNLALQGHVIQAAYSSSKAAVIQMTRAIATSHGRAGIRCNAVLPGLTGTPAALENLPPELHKAVLDETPVGFLGVPDDIAHLVVFLASDAARNITGQTMASDGGTSIHVPGYGPLNSFFGGPGT